MNSKFPELKNNLLKIFEPELTEELLQCPLVEIAGKVTLGETGDEIKYLPLVVKGSVRAVKEDEKIREILIYNVKAIELCIISTTSIMRNDFIGKAKAITNEETAMILIPLDKPAEWLNKYKSWFIFIIGLYERRLDELILQHHVVNNQKIELTQQHKDITDSINYAKRIQNAILPPDTFINRILPEYFILFKPRNIVSGDYYWMAQIENKTIVAVADCTGHGVPGAFMSILGSTLLNQIVTGTNTLSVNEILNQLRKKIKETLRQHDHGSDTKDGMDMALFIMDFDTHILEYSGAFNPLLIVRNHELIELKPDRMPIGVHFYDDKSFTKQEFKFEKGDVFYAYSDGYADQFSEKHNKKFLSKQFKQLLVEINHLSLCEQRQVLDSRIEQWKGDFEQVDDILVMGIKAN